MKTSTTPILIIGGSSVGMSLANELAHRNINCILVEKQKGINPHPRANAVANRTMEFYRRWGIDQALIDNGISPDSPADYLYTTSMNGRLVYKISLPSHNQLMALADSGADDKRLHHSPYLKTILGQNEVDKILKNHVLKQPKIDARYGWELIGFRQVEQPKHHVVAMVKNGDTGEIQEIVADYMVACDGGQSLVRTTMGVPLKGKGGLAHFVAIHFKAPGLNRKFGHGNIYFQLKKQYGGFLMNWDGGTTYTFHHVLKDGQDWQDVDPVDLIQKIAGWNIPVEIFSTQPWTAHQLVAEYYRRGHIFLTGDAAHLFTPTGGFGMNTGVADAMDIAWKLQAMLEGWGGDGLLDSYHEERRPIGVQNTATSAGYFYALNNSFRFGEELDEDTAEGETARQTLVSELDGQVGLIDSSGLLLGYRYEGSSICVSDGTEAVPFDPQHYWPTTRPGHRLPHLWVKEGVSVLDLLGREFTLIRTDPDVNVDDFRGAAEAAGLPLKILDVSAEIFAETYEKKLVLVRPDLMVAWRGDTTPNDVTAVIDQVRGCL
ncbi:MAG: hypothetical protein COB36_09395 [Alphaproteobacteria bacterium]|nr:MAG: hypothetical protein COB36_09395 [Alphaproteobacteria bacterium]